MLGPLTLIIALSIVIQASSLPLYPLEAEERLRPPTSRIDRRPAEPDMESDDWMRIYRIMNIVKRANAKRNFDELDGSRFGAFYKRKRNFDQLDGAGFGSLNRYFS